MKDLQKHAKAWVKWLEYLRERGIEIKPLEVGAEDRISITFDGNFIVDKMLYAILEDFCDEHGVYIQVDTVNVKGDTFKFLISGFFKDEFETERYRIISDQYGYKTRTEARLKAYEKAFEIINGRV